jgi:hypothetical protein
MSPWNPGNPDRLERILTMVYVVQNSQNFSGLFSIVLYSKKTRRFGNWISFRPQVKVGVKTPTQLGPLERDYLQWLRLALSKGPNWVGVFSPPSPEDGNRSSFRNVVFFGIQDDGKKSRKILWILYNIHYRQNPFKPISNWCGEWPNCSLIRCLLHNFLRHPVTSSDDPGCAVSVVLLSLPWKFPDSILNWFTASPFHILPS